MNQPLRILIGCERAGPPLRFGSVCSGIEAASVAWEPLGWRAAWVSEIEAFPSAVLAHHWPSVPNLGNMLALPDRVARGEIEAPDVLVGGTPCQAFSVAGKRGSLADERGALTLAYVELLNEIDRARAAAGSVPAIAVWENVPGVLSTKDNAFGCFLAGLAGEDQPLFPAGPRWPNAGCVFGPPRTVAWRILDAQYFGVAQRRRRVFVVASARDGFDPAAVLFEFDGLRRDSAPRREAGQGFAADVAPSLVRSGRGVERVGETRGQDPVVAVPYQDVSHCLNAGGMGRIDYETESFVVSVTGQITHALNTANNGKGSSEDGTGRGVPTVAHTVALRGREGGGMAELGGEVATALRASSGGGDKPHVLAFSAKDYGADATEELAPTMRAGGHKDSHANAGVMPAVAIHGTQDPIVGGDCALPLGRNQGQENAVVTSLAVRRLTPRECERLQGFHDDHTLVPYRGKPAADGPRYKAIGNSMAVPVMAWIGRRIAAHLTPTQQEARHAR